MKEAKIIRLLLPLLRMYPWALPATIVLGTMSSLAEGVVLSLFVPLLQSLGGGTYVTGSAGGLQSVIDRMLRSLPPGGRLEFIAGAILALTIVKGILTYAHSALAAALNARVTHTIRTKMFSRMIGLDHARLQQMESGRLINLLATDTWHTSDAISMVVNLVINTCSVLVFSTLLVALSPGLTIVVIVGVAVISLLLQAITLGARRLGRQGVEANAILSGHILDGLGGIAVIQMYGLAAYRSRLFDAISTRVRSIYLRLDLLHRAMPPVSEILYIALLLGILFIAVQAHNSITTVVVFLLVLYRLQPQIRQLDSGRLSLVALTSSVEDVMRFLQLEEPPGAPDCARRCAIFQREIRLERVGFYYDRNDEFALKDICCRIPKGRTTAILGPSGSGKSTLIALLCRFREPVEGEIVIDGKPLAGLDVQDWRRQIAWAGQDAYLFSATVRENIRYGNLDASDDEIRAAAHEADADAFIRQLPQGYDTIIGDGGAALSGGQIQRISLARALLRDPELLILDEATSALDSISEDSIQEFLRKRAGRQTIVVISHRLSTVRYADQVIVLSKGCVSEQGSPKELLAQRGFVCRLRELQHVE